ncbi:MAG TPA: peptide chain release factor N(5)-glutamine methyltransferase [Bacteroidota bacterium]|nr:peptide chain release factor N(5)-glutamine methyltransferase [Bacteroidota bacterium]
MLKQETRAWTVKDLMKVCIDLLTKKGIDEARLNVELLLAHALQVPRLYLYTNFDKPLNKSELRTFRELLERRLNREPVQYILGSSTFMGLKFGVDQRVLIPRPETETLVEQALLAVKEVSEKKRVTILDIGTGSGNIAVSVAKFDKECDVVAIDSSAAALEVAVGNAERNEVLDRIVFKEMDVFEPIDQLLLRRFDLVLSNPPYVPEAEYETLAMEIRRFEPQAALVAGKDGLDYCRRIIELAPFLVSDKGQLLIEIGFGQHSMVIELMENAGFSEVVVTPDLQGVPRVISARVPSRTRNQGHVN